VQDNAVTPDKSAILDVVKQLKATDKVVNKKIDKKDESYYHLSMMTGWENIKNYIEKRKKHLMNTLDESVVDKSLSEIGTKYIMVRQIIVELDNLVSLVEKSSNFVDKLDNEQFTPNK